MSWEARSDASFRREVVRILKPGELHLAVFDQDEVWVDAYVVVHDLKSMSTDYLVNVLALMVEQAVGYHDACLSLQTVLAAITAPEGARAGLERVIDDLVGVPQRSTVEDARAWLEGTLLWARITALIHERSGLG